jgi:hypothetical protein
MGLPDPIARHLQAAKTHDEAADRHDEAVAFWLKQGFEDHADLERRNSVIERDAAQLERDRADLVKTTGEVSPARRGPV